MQYGPKYTLYTSIHKEEIQIIIIIIIQRKQKKVKQRGSQQQQKFQITHNFETFKQLYFTIVTQRAAKSIVPKLLR